MSATIVLKRHTLVQLFSQFHFLPRVYRKVVCYEEGYGNARYGSARGTEEYGVGTVPLPFPTVGAQRGGTTHLPSATA